MLHEDEVRRRLSIIERDRAAEGRYPYDGEWLSKAEIDERILQRQKASFRRLMQVVGVLAAMTLGGLVLLIVLIAMCY